MKAVKLFVFGTIGAAMLTLTSCETKVADIPPGFVAKILTESGWERDVREAGQVNIGTEDSDGSRNLLVLLEATSITVKESFEKEAKEDHRIVFKGSTLATVDIRTQLRLPENEKLRNAVFSQITPVPYEAASSDLKDRVRVIYLQSVYNQFAQMSVRGKLREIFARYEDYSDAIKNYAKINAEVALAISEVFKQNKVPLEFVNAQISNIMPDEVVGAANNKLAAADAEVLAIEKVGDALRKNPGYIQTKKWDVIREVAQKNPNFQITVIEDGRGNSNISIPSGK